MCLNVAIKAVLQIVDMFIATAATHLLSCLVTGYVAVAETRLSPLYDCFEGSSVSFDIYEMNLLN